MSDQESKTNEKEKNKKRLKQLKNKSIKQSETDKEKRFKHTQFQVKAEPDSPELAKETS